MSTTAQFRTPNDVLHCLRGDLSIPTLCKGGGGSSRLCGGGGVDELCEKCYTWYYYS